MSPSDLLDLAQRLSRIEGVLTEMKDQLDDVHDEVRTTNGRVTKLETAAATAAAVVADREARQIGHQRTVRWRLEVAIGAGAALFAGAGLELVRVLIGG